MKIFFLKHFIQNLVSTKFRYWLSLPIFNAYMMLEVVLDELCKRIRNLDFALIRPIQARLISSVAFVAFVAFWGNTMLFFEKFTKNRIFFIPLPCLYLKKKKSYGQMKIDQILTFWHLIFAWFSESSHFFGQTVATPANLTRYPC